MNHLITNNFRLFPTITTYLICKSKFFNVTSEQKMVGQKMTDF